MFKKIIIATLVLSLLTMCLFANGETEKKGGNEEVLIWSFNLSPEALSVVQSEIIGTFQEDNPGITVNWQNIPYAGFREKLLTAAAGDVLPDIFIDGYNMLGTYQSTGIIANLDDEVGTWSRWDEIQKSLRDLTYYDGKCYGMPFETKVTPVVINTRIFKECGLDPDNPPQTWSEALAAGEKMLKVKDGAVVQAGASGFKDSGSLGRGFDMFVQQDGGNFLNEDGTPAFNDEHGMEALDFLKKLYKLQEPEGVAPLDSTTMLPFLAGKSGMSIMQSCDVIQIGLQTENEEVLKNAKIIPPFRSDSEDGKPVSFFDGAMLFLASSSDCKDSAWKFIQYFYEPDNFIIFAKANKDIPIYDSQMDSDYMRDNPLFQGLMEMQKYGGKLAATPAYRSARAFLTDEIEKTIYQGQSYEETLANSEKAWLREIEDMK